MGPDLALRADKQRLVAYAVFNVVLWSTSGSAVQGTYRALFPLLVTALKHTSGLFVTTAEVSDRLKELFGLTFPQQVMNGMLRAASQEKLLSRATDDDVTVLTVDRQALADYADTEELAVGFREDHGKFLRALRRFGRERFGENFSREEADTALHTLLLERVDSISTIQDYANVGSEWSSNLRPGAAGYILGRFIEEEVHPGTELHEYLTRLARGSALAVAVFYRGDQVERLARPMKRLQVFFDTPLLLSLLGYHKPEDEAAAEDVLQLVKDSSAVPCVFAHTCEEIGNVLIGAVHDMRNAQHGQALESTMPVVETFVQKALNADGPVPSRDRYVLDADGLRQALERRGFEVVDRPLEPGPDEDVDGLRTILQERYAADPHRRVIQFDVDSLLGIRRIRSGRRPTGLAEAGAVFVTSNPELDRAAAIHFNETTGTNRARVCYTSDALANLLWLRRPLELPDMPWRQVVAYVHASLYPSEELWRKYRDFLDELRSRTEPITDADYFILRYSIDARQALMDDTRGEPEALTITSITDILETARSSLVEEYQDELDRQIAALDSVEQQLAQLQASHSTAERKQAEAEEEAAELRNGQLALRNGAIRATIQQQCRRRARIERRVLRAVAIAAIPASLATSFTALAGVGVPVTLSLLVVAMTALLAIFGYRNIDHGWTFAAFEERRVERLTARRYERTEPVIDLDSDP